MAKKVAKPVESEGGNQQTPEHITKSDAVRRALAAGIEGPQEGTAWIQKEFGIELSPSHFMGGFNALFADSTVRFIYSRITPRVLKALIIGNGAEVI